MRKEVLALAIAACFVIAILFAKQMDFFFVLMMSELLVIFIVASLLYRIVPLALFQASRDNCFRVDGTLSQRREWLERKATLKVYVNLLGITALVAMAGNLLVLWIDASILPLSLATDTLTLFCPDLPTWRDRISEAKLDDAFLDWSTSGETDPNYVKTTFPAIFGIALFWLIGSALLILWTYRFSLSQFELGIRMRNKEYIDRDIGRFQSHKDYRPLEIGLDGISG